MKYNLFLDDIRSVENTFNYMKDIRYLKLDWIIVRNYAEFVAVIEEKGIPELVSYDHDLGDDEIWLDINGYEGLYEISSKGNVLSIPRRTTKGGILKPIKTESGLMVTLHNCNTKKRRAIHRIVAEMFIPNPENKKTVNHIDGNRWNNNISNLEWATDSENIKHSYDFLKRNYTAFGENHANSKTVSQYDLNNILIDTYGSVNEAGRQTGISFENIATTARGIRKKAGGFIWKYENREPSIKATIEHMPKSEKDYTASFFIPKHEETGADCAKYLISKLSDGQQHPEYIVHSMNPVGAQNIRNIIKDSYDKHRKTI